jgi:hypothetical protein
MLDDAKKYVRTSRKEMYGGAGAGGEVENGVQGGDSMGGDWTVRKEVWV